MPNPRKNLSTKSSNKVFLSSFSLLKVISAMVINDQFC